MAMSATERENKKLEANQLPLEDNDTTNLPQAFAVHVPDPAGSPRVQNGLVEQAEVIVYQYPSSANPPVRDNGAVQCCYPITVADPVEVVHARKVAITHVCIEAAALMFCRSGWCVIAFLMAIPASSIVACCVKHRTTYVAWSAVGSFVCWLHVIAASEAFEYDTNEYYSNDFRVSIGSVQTVLCGLSVVVMYYGCKAASALRESIHPVGVQVGVPMPTPTYPPA